MADFTPGRPRFDLENIILNIRAEVTALELAFEVIIPESDTAGILKIDRVLGYQIGLIQNDGRRALERILGHLRDEIEDLTTGTVGRIA